jgi:serine/threonine-protein kinase
VADALRSPFAPPAWQPGTVVKERYRLEALLRRGGMGSVWKAHDLVTDAPVALKGLEPDIARDRVMVRRFLREAQAAQLLESPNVVRIFDYGVDDDQAFIAMELLDGEPLSERITRVGRLTPEEVLRFVSDIVRAIEPAHAAGIIHRDLKPDNVFICRGEPEVAKVLDFGVAKVKKGALWTGTGTATQTGLMLGTPYYMSPEQTQARPIDQRTDLWAIAVVTFEALLGQRPFDAETFGDLVIAICTAPTPIPSRVGPVPAGFDEWFVRATQRDRARRFQTAGEMLDELTTVLAPGPGQRRVSGRLPALGASVAPAAQSLAPQPPGSTAPRPSARALTRPEPSDLQLTTGQRAAITRSASAAPGRGGRAGLFLLLGLAGLIVAGVAAFAFGGGARALRQAELGTAALAVTPPAVPAAPPLAPEPSAKPAGLAPAPASGAPRAPHLVGR